MKKFFLVIFLQVYSITLFGQITNIENRGIGGGGALFFPKINPANDDEFYIACDMSQLFHSTNFGRDYSQIHFEKLPVGNTSTYEFTVNSNIAYSIYNDGNDGYPVRTVDGGQSWQALPGNQAGLGLIYKLTANYNDPAQLILNHYGDIMISNDSGNTFQVVKNATNMGVGIILSGVHFDGNIIYVATNEGMLFSNDSGNSFSNLNTSGIPSSQAIWHFSSAKAGSSTRFVCLTADIGDVYNGIQPWEYYNFAKGVYTMDNNSGTWTSRGGGINFSNDFVMYTGMASNDINTIYLAGNDDALGAPLVCKTTDGGITWQKIFLSDNNQNIFTGWSGHRGDKSWGWGETCFGIAVAPNNSNKVIFGDFGFVHVSDNGGTSWKQAYVNQSDQHSPGIATPIQQPYHSIGLENTTCWQVQWLSPNTMLAAFSDIGMIRSTDAGLSWGFTYSGMGVNSVYRLASMPGRVFAATSGIHDMYQSTRLADAQLDANDPNGRIFTSNDFGESWSTIHTFNHPVFWLDIDPTNPNRMYCSVVHYGGGGSGMQGGIWKTDDLNNLASSTWTQLPAPPRTEGHPATVKVLNDGKVLCTFSGRRNSSGTFTASSGVFLYDPNLNSWTDLSDPGMSYWTKDIVVDPNDTTQNTWYACVFSGWGGAPNGLGGLYMTSDRGNSWTKLTGTQFDRVTSITFHPLNSAELYLTTETQGLWYCADRFQANPSWTLIHEYKFRQPERVFFNPYLPEDVWISSFGNGMKKGYALTASINLVSHKTSAIKLYPNPCKDFIIVQPETATESESMLHVYDIFGRKVKSVEISKSNNTIDVRNVSPGIYYISFGNFNGRIVKQK